MVLQNKTVDKACSVTQLKKTHHVNKAIQQKQANRHGLIIFIHDNARPRTSNIVKETECPQKEGSLTFDILSGSFAII